MPGGARLGGEGGEAGTGDRADACASPLLAPLFAERVRKLLHPEGATVDTTLDAGTQASVEQLGGAAGGAAAARVDGGAGGRQRHAGGARLRRLGRFFRRRALLASSDMVQGRRSPGSALNPSLYGLALDEG